jgi:hypothetical protein
MAELTTLIRGNLPPIDRTRVGNQLVADVYQRDSIALLAQHQLTDTESFVWQSYLKAEYQAGVSDSEGGDDSGAGVAMAGYAACGFRAPYSFMHTSGAHALPVLTPSSDKARLALVRCLSTGALEGRGAVVLGGGGGGAGGGQGVGKTAIADSACRLLGRQIVPLTCTSATLASSAAAMLSGCAGAGCVLRLDDPGALSPSALATLSHCLTSLFAALAAAAGPLYAGAKPSDSTLTTATLLGNKITLKPSFAVVAEVSLPPTGGGGGGLFNGPYGSFSGGLGGGVLGSVGGSVLPPHVRSRFRPISVPAPDLDTILSVKLLQEVWGCVFLSLYSLSILASSGYCLLPVCVHTNPAPFFSHQHHPPTTQGFLNWEGLGPKLRMVIDAFPSVSTSTPLHSVGSGRSSWGLPALTPFVAALGILKRTSPEV